MAPNTRIGATSLFRWSNFECSQKSSRWRSASIFTLICRFSGKFEWKSEYWWLTVILSGQPGHAKKNKTCHERRVTTNKTLQISKMICHFQFPLIFLESDLKKHFWKTETAALPKASWVMTAAHCMSLWLFEINIGLFARILLLTEDWRKLQVKALRAFSFQKVRQERRWEYTCLSW